MSNLRIIPLGGLGEIGLNLMAIECDRELLIIDCGVLFPDLHWLGLDLVLPDFSYLKENEKKIRGLVVTHGHEDHIGAIPFLLKKVKIPSVYCSRFAGRLITEKCQEYGVADSLNISSVCAGDKKNVGKFKVEFIHVTHSTLETFALGIQTPAGLVVHSGDFKFDETPYDGPPSDKARLKELGEQKPLLLLSDSTNSEVAGHSASESSIGEELQRLISKSSGAVIVALFASNIHRVHQLMDIAERLGRKVFLSGRSMERYVHIAMEENFLPVKGSLLRPIEEIGSFDRREILVLSTGSQGEARSSLLRLAKNENRWLKISPGDTVILSSRNIPGNERAISYVINQLFRLGAEVHYKGLKDVHVSGHAYQNEQLDLLKLIRPRFFIPIHGEYRHLALHAQTAADSGLVEKSCVVENGQVWECDPETGYIRTDETVATGRYWVFQGNSGAMDEESIKARRVAARAGVVVVSCIVGKRATELKHVPKVELNGFLCDSQKLNQVQRTIVEECTSAFETWHAGNEEGFTREQFVAAAARRVVKRHLNLKPLVIVTFTTA